MRFSYVKYDDKAMTQQQTLKQLFEGVEAEVNKLEDGRAKSLVFTKLEEAYMWAGKAIRDSQIKRNPATTEQPERNNE